MADNTRAAPDSGSVDYNDTVPPPGGVSINPNEPSFTTFGAQASEGEIEKLEAIRSGALNPFQNIIDKSDDNMTMDFEPASRDDPSLVNILGRGMTADQVSRLDGGKQLMDIIRKSREGPRGFWEAAIKRGEGTFAGMDVTDLPFAGDVLGAAIPIREMKKVVGTLKALDKGENVSDQDLVYARLYLADQERRGQSDKWGVLGDVVHGLPTLGAEMWLGAELGAAVTGVVAGPTALTGVGLPEAAVMEAGGAAVGGLTALGRGIAKMAVRRTADNAAKAWLKKGVAKAFMQFTEDTVGEGAAKLGWKQARHALSSAGQDLLVTAPIKGLGYFGLDVAANAGINAAMGEDLLSSRNQRDKEIQGAMSGDDRLVANAQWLALGDQFVNYYTEMAGEGLAELIGIPLQPVKKYAGATVGHIPAMKKYVKLIEDTWGKPEELAARREELVGFSKAVDPVERAKGISTLGLWMVNKMVDNNMDVSHVADFFRETGYHGWIGEMAEERYGGFLNGLYGSDGGDPGFKNAWDKMWPDRRQMFAEAIGFAIPLAVMHATAHAQQSKFLGGDELSNAKRASQALRNVINGSGVFGIFGAPRDAEGATPATTTTPNRLGQNDLRLAEDVIMNESAGARDPTANGSSVMQRILKGAFGIANVLVSGDFSRLSSRSLDSLIYNYGIGPQFVGMARDFEEGEAKAVREKMIAKRVAAGVDLGDVSAPELDMEAVRASEPVQKAKRAYVRAQIAAFAGELGRIVRQRTDLDTIAAEHGEDPAAFEARLQAEVDSGRISVLDIRGRKQILHMTADGQTVANATLAAMEKLIAPSRARKTVVLNSEVLSRLKDKLAGVDINRKLLSGDHEELLKLAVSTGYAVGSNKDLTLLHDFVKLTHELQHAPNRAGTIRLTAKDGRKIDVFASPNRDGKFGVRPLSKTAEGKALFSEMLGEKGLEMERGALLAELTRRGFSPEERATPYTFIRQTDIMADDPVALAYALGYDQSRLDDKYMEAYNKQKDVARGTGPAAKAAQAHIAAQQNVAKKDLLAIWDVGESDVRVRIGGKDMWRFTVGGMSSPHGVYVAIPPNLSHRGAHGSLIEEMLEDGQKRTFLNKDGKYQHPRYQKIVLRRLTALATKMSLEEKTRNPKLSSELESAAKVMAGSDGANYSDDALSKPVGSMLFGHADASVVEGSRMAQAAAWVALRERAMADLDTPDGPGLRTLLSGFLSKYLRATQGWQIGMPFADLPTAYFPRDVQAGFERRKVDGVEQPKSDPYLDLLTLDKIRKEGEAALDKRVVEETNQAVLEHGLTPGQAGGMLAEGDAYGAARLAQFMVDARAQVVEAKRREREVEDKKDAAFGEPAFADVGYASEEEAKADFAIQAIGNEEYEEFLKRKWCLTVYPNLPGPGNAAKGKTSGKRERRGK